MGRKDPTFLSTMNGAYGVVSTKSGISGRGRSPRGPGMLMAVAAVVATAVLTWVMLRLTAEGLDVADKVGSVVSAAVSAASLVVTVLAAGFVRSRRMAREGHSSTAALQVARGDLLKAVREQWLEEARVRALRRPSPLRVTWSAVPRPELVHSPIGGDDSPSQVVMSGDLSEVAGVFRGLRHRQLVILGEPGAGKTATAILMMLELIEDVSTRQGDDAEPIPILISPSGWDPVARTFPEWLSGHVLEMYPWLDTRDHQGVRMVDQLLRGRHLLPIVDGLDEMLPELRAAAIDALDRGVPADQPLILTSRTSEYESAIEKSGAPLVGSTVIELKPPTVEDIEAFLANGRFGHLWRPVLKNMRLNPDGPIASTMSTPLLVTLAQFQYSRRDADPSELTRLATSEEVHNHVLGTFVPRAYSDEVLGGDNSKARKRYPSERAAAWLTFLATSSATHDSEDIQWWHIADAVPPIAIVAAAGVFGGGALGVVTTAISGPTISLVTAGPVAVACSLMAYLIAPMRPSPRRVVLRLHSTPRLLGNGLLGALPFSLALGSSFSAVAALIAGWIGAAIAGSLTTIGLTLLLGLLRWLEASEGGARAESPGSLLASDRTASIANGVAFGAVVSVATAIPAMRAMGIVLGLIAGLCVGMFGLAPIAVLFSAWGRFTVARIWLAGQGHLPLTFMSFLDDAHRRGVLRQAGTSYRFRHVLVRDHLSSPPVSPLHQSTLNA